MVVFCYRGGFFFFFFQRKVGNPTRGVLSLVGIAAYTQKIQSDSRNHHDPASGNHRMTTSQQRVEFRTSLALANVTSEPTV
jgi:hypothetical protein